jgi:hypothetical protein
MKISPRTPNEILEIYKEEIEFAATKLGIAPENRNGRIQLTLLVLNVDALARTNSHAPELYAALESVCGIWGSNDDEWFQGDMDSAVTEARIALAKARGEAS